MRSTIGHALAYVVPWMDRATSELRGRESWRPSDLALIEELRREQAWLGCFAEEPRTWARFCEEALGRPVAEVDAQLAKRARTLKEAGHVCALCGECKRCSLCGRGAPDVDARGWIHETADEPRHAECVRTAHVRREGQAIGDARVKLLDTARARGRVETPARLPKSFFQYVAPRHVFQVALAELVREGALVAERRDGRTVYVLGTDTSGAR